MKTATFDPALKVNFLFINSSVPNTSPWPWRSYYKRKRKKTIISHQQGSNGTIFKYFRTQRDYILWEGILRLLLEEASGQRNFSIRSSRLTFRSVPWVRGCSSAKPDPKHCSVQKQTFSTGARTARCSRLRRLHTHIYIAIAHRLSGKRETAQSLQRVQGPVSRKSR